MKILNLNIKTLVKVFNDLNSYKFGRSGNLTSVKCLFESGDNFLFVLLIKEQHKNSGFEFLKQSN